MSRSLQVTRSLLRIAALSLLGLLATAAGAQEADLPVMRATAEEPGAADYGSWSIALDNDFFSFSQRDRDYTGGFALTLTGERAAQYWWSLDPLLSKIDSVLPGLDRKSDTTLAEQSAQIGLISFTPRDLTTPAVAQGDRPYASLLFVTSGREYLLPDGHHTRYSALTLGALGLALTADIHKAIHDATGSDQPRGYAHQISAGGELTARYVTGGSRLGLQRLALGSGLWEIKSTWEASVGYLTEASYAISTRIGNVNSPWYTFNPERTDYIAQPAPVAGGDVPEFYFWAGAKVRVRAYNAFLQGQFRDSDYTLSSSELQHVIGELWLGATTTLHGGTRISYALRLQTAEIRDGVGDRSPFWGSIAVSRSF